MQRVATPEVLDGPDNFWRAVKYFYKQPAVGLVAVRSLLSHDQVESIRAASRSTNPSARRYNMPHVLQTRAALTDALMTHGIMPSMLEVFNKDKWDPQTDFDLSLEDCLLTRFGKSVGPHSDVLGNKRPIGVSVSISIGRCTFAAGLPPTELTAISGATEEEYFDWHLRAVENTDVLHSAELKAGDAALWLQPGVHEAYTDEPDRFACMYITAIQQ